MLIYVLLTLLASSVTGAKDHAGHDDPVTRTCKLIEHYHCDYFHDEPQCGTDQRTYRNMCEFSKAHCDMRELHIAHEGACVQTTTSASTESSRPTARPGGDTVYRFFCQNLGHQRCGSHQEILCGSDGITYSNLCMFEKARCQDQSLTVTSSLACPVHSS